MHCELFANLKSLLQKQMNVLKWHLTTSEPEINKFSGIASQVCSRNV